MLFNQVNRLPMLPRGLGEDFIPLKNFANQWEATTKKSASGVGADQWIDVIGGLNLNPAGAVNPELLGTAGNGNANFSLAGGAYFTSPAVPVDVTANLHRSDQSHSLSFIVQWDTIGGQDALMDTRGGASTNPGCNAIIDDQYRYRFIARSNANWLTPTNRYVQLPVSDYKNGWVWIFQTYDHTTNTVKIYCNGILLDEYTLFTNTMENVPLFAAGRLTLGVYGTIASPFAGRLKSVAIAGQVADVGDVADYYTRIHWNVDISATNYIQKPFYGSTTYNFPLLARGQSLVEKALTDFSGAGQKAFDARMAQYAAYTGMVNLAKGSTPYVKASGGADYFINDDAAPTYAEGTLYDLHNLYPDGGQDVYVLHKQASSDINAGATKANIKAAYIYDAETLLPARYANFQKMILCPWHRNTGAGWTLTKEKPVIEALQEAIAESASIIAGPDSYDLDLADAVHWTEAGFVEFYRRAAEYYAAALGLRDAPAPVSMVSASVAGAVLTITVALGDATDITIDADAWKGFVFTDDTDGDIAATAIEKVNGTTIDITLASTPTDGTGKLYVIDNGLSTTNAEVVRGNDPLALPLRSGYIELA